jgi:hypothetical protein
VQQLLKNVQQRRQADAQFGRCVLALLSTSGRYSSRLIKSK